MEIDFLELNEDKPYYEVEIWPQKYNGDFESRYFTTLKEAKADFKKRTRGHESDCIKHHLGERFGWRCEIVK